VSPEFAAINRRQHYLFYGMQVADRETAFVADDSVLSTGKMNISQRSKAIPIFVPDVRAENLKPYLCN
jgi:hypothetical protein